MEKENIDNKKCSCEGNCNCIPKTENNCCGKCSHGPRCNGKCFWVGATFRILIVVAIIIGAFKFGVHHGMLMK